jgi:signal transduction histidine kinase
MRRFFFFSFVFLISQACLADDGLESYFRSIKELHFEEAKKIALSEQQTELRFELLRHSDLLYYAGQQDKQYYSSAGDGGITEENDVISIIRLLNAGYFNLFYDQAKGNAYRYFYKACQISNKIENPVLTKASIYALLKYYSFEIAQNGDFFRSYVNQLENLKTDSVDDFWLTIYQLIFYSKSIGGLDSAYFKLSKKLDILENSIEEPSPLLIYVYYEKALKFYLENNLSEATKYYNKVVDKSTKHPFLVTERFLSLIKLMLIETSLKNFSKAHEYLNQAKQVINKADTLRSSYYLNANSSLLFKAESKSDTAYSLLLKAYLQEFQLDFRRNTLEINRLNVELETQEKENANLRLRQGRIWMISALSITGLLAIATYFAYNNQRSKNRIQRREAEGRMEKLLKEQELVGINSMLEGQEKERQRIANELHDNLGSLLTTLKFHFHAFLDNPSNANAQSNPALDKTNTLIDEAYEKVRSIAHVQNAGVNAQEGLLPAVKNFASKVSIANNLEIEVNEHGLDRQLDNAFEITAFRIIQELVANIIKHSRATLATISLTQHEHAMNIMVEDNGVGFDISETKPSAGMGLYSIQKRVESAGGSVTIESVPKNGTTVIIDLPIASAIAQSGSQ